jgi:14-3-3 protein epsilon
MSVLWVMAQTAWGAERYEDTCHHVNLYAQELVRDKKSLTVEEKNILDGAYKRVSATLRETIKTLSELIKQSTNEVFKSALQGYKKEAEAKLSLVCNEMLNLLETFLIPAAQRTSSYETLICYRTMAGDYHRYLAKHVSESVHKAGAYYEQAYVAAQEHLSVTSGVRLGVANNYSVFCYEVLNDKERACSLSQIALDGGAAEIDTLDSSEYNECMCTLQVLMTNCKLWSVEKEAEKANDRTDMSNIESK